jgi:hypothetical protein
MNMEHMFEFASSFDKNLCVWGSSLNPDTIVAEMFVGTNCPLAYISPSLESNPVGPFCDECLSHNSTNSTRTPPLPNLVDFVELPLIPVAMGQLLDGTILAWASAGQQSQFDFSLPEGTWVSKINPVTKTATANRIEST